MCVSAVTALLQYVACAQILNTGHLDCVAIAQMTIGSLHIEVSREKCNLNWQNIENQTCHERAQA